MLLLLCNPARERARDLRGVYNVGGRGGSDSSALAPALDGARVEERGRGHDTVALEDEAVLHDEADVAQGVDVLERVAADGDEVGEEPGPDRSALLLQLRACESGDGHGLERVGGGDPGVLPGREEIVSSPRLRVSPVRL